MTIIKFPKREEREKDEQEEKETKKPRNKKTEPRKPWGRNERLLVSSLLISTALVSGLLALSARAWKLPGLPQITLPDLGLEKTYIIEANRPTPPASDSIINEFKALISPLSGNYGFYVVRPNLNQSYGHNHQDIFQAASLIKLPVMLALLREVESENIDLASTYTITDADKVAGAGSLYYKPAGTIVTYKDLITLMGHESDNTAFHIAVKTLGEEKINTTLSALNMNNTSLKDNLTTPRDIGQFFTELVNPQLISPEHAQLIIDSLTDTIFEDYLPVGIPDHLRVAHKYGREIHVLNDAGIVLTQEPFILVLMSEGIVDAEAESIFPKLSELIYHFETSQ